MAELTSLAEAVAALVRDGDTVALEGFTHLIPHAAGHELIRQERRELTLVRMTPDVVYDQLIGAGLRARSSSSRGAATPASARCTGCATRSSTAGRGRSSSRSTRTPGWRRRTRPARRTCPSACSAAMPAATCRPARASRAITCPFTGEELAAVPAHRPDVGVIHAQRADRRGNVQLWGIVGVQKETVLASARSIATVEEVVDELAPQPGAIVLPHWTLDAVCVAPRGAHPSYAHGYYERDNDFYVALGRDQPRPRHVHAPGSSEHVLSGVAA